jgi:anaerobic selenocysteine-containing dehydrogenase
MITGQGNGQGAREQGQKCDQLPGARDLENPAHREYIAGVWGVEESTIPHTGLSAVPLVEAIHGGRIKGLLLLCFNPAVSLPDGDFVREALSRLEYFAVIDFFMSETARYADVVLPGSLMEEDEGTTTNVEGRVIHHRQVVRPPDGAREDWRIICDLARRLGAGDKFPYQSTRRSEELRVASRASPTTPVPKRIDREMGFSGRVRRSIPGTPRRTKAGVSTRRRQGALPADRSAVRRYSTRLSDRAHDRTGRVAYLSGTRRAASARWSIISTTVRSTAPGRRAWHRRRRLRPRREPPWRGRRPRAGRKTIRPDTALPLRPPRPLGEQLHDPRNRSDLEDP